MVGLRSNMTLMIAGLILPVMAASTVLSIVAQSRKTKGRSNALNVIYRDTHFRNLPEHPPRKRAATTFTIYGDRGDTGAHDECPAGQYLVGVIGNTGDWIDQITVICAKPGPDLTFSGRRSIASRGGGTGAYTEAYCNADEAVSGVWLARNKGYEIVFVEMTCLSIKTGVIHTLSYGKHDAPYTNTQNCPPISWPQVSTFDTGNM